MRVLNFILAIFLINGAILSCKQGKTKNPPVNFKYEQFKDSLSKVKYDSLDNSSNLFDSSAFNPRLDSLDTLLQKMDTLWHRELARMQQIDTLIKVMKKGEKYTPEEIATVKANLESLDSFLQNKNVVDEAPCNENGCALYADIVKSTQTLYLYIGGELKDSFKVSTGIKKYETPTMNRRPSGPLFIKYKSRKFPGGNYMGLGNMPYAVFLRGGYAIHGTTPGNFSKLGTKASHGCIRLHPFNAKIFYELVKRIGIRNTWVTIRDSIPN